MQRFRVAVQASDPISHTGITRYLASRPQVRLVAPAEADVVVLAPARLDPQSLAPRRRAARPAILVTNRIGESDLVNLVESRISAVLPRVAATDHRLLDAIASVTARQGAAPDDLLAELVARAEHLRHEVLEARGLRIGDLAPREVDVLRLMADGLDTAEIAEKLCYSQRTVKNIIHGVNSRLGLRNRQHAVAFAMRTGVI
ncbi:helix-turn-helix transcriptional regulator [Kutzneria chonburiensis]|uniref:Response regulator transcription factor n=1 Tax=Kutzneria chonburiensis TaxID=1483604 RepID=A0ABV6N754_9PSEU|nr:LuxR C-terminal-related transcriptional regulator [Kutzneria chonburiensis]